MLPMSLPCSTAVLSKNVQMDYVDGWERQATLSGVSGVDNTISHV